MDRNTSQQPNRERKKEYTPPEVVELGNVQDLTRVGVSVGCVDSPEEMA